MPARACLPHPRPARAAAVTPGLGDRSLAAPDACARRAEQHDVESRRWLQRLGVDAHDRPAAIAELHELLRAAARYEVRRRARSLMHVDRAELEDLAAQCADDALVAVLAKLGDYRGASRFTTWAHKFALLEAATAMRRRAWRGREVPVSDERWSLLEHVGPSPDAGAETAELLAAIARAIDAELTRHQREVLVALAVDGVPIDVLAERFATTRGALYKTLHDARRKLRRRLRADGLLDDA